MSTENQFIETEEQSPSTLTSAGAQTAYDPFTELPEEDKKLPEQFSDIVDTVVESTTIGLLSPNLGERIRKKEVPQDKSGCIHSQDDTATSPKKKGFLAGVKKFFARKESWFAVLGLLFTVIFIAVALIYPQFFDQLKAWGYIGLFIISLLGSSVAIIPVPGMAVQFALGAALPPPFGWPLWAGPVVVGFIGAVAETVGAFTIYMAGVGGSASLNENAKKSAGRWARIYNWIIRLMKRHSFLAVFLVSAVPNPLFYPVSLTAGAANIGKRKFILLVLLGKFIKCCLIAYLGYWALGSVAGI